MDRFWADADFFWVVDVLEITRWESAVFTKKKTGQVQREGWSWMRESGLQVPGSLL